MPYHIETFDKPDHAAMRKDLRDVHITFLDEHAALLLACGAKLDDAGEAAGGGVYIVDVEQRAEAQAFIEADPYHRNGLFREVRITRWRKAFLAGKSYLG